LRANGLVQVVLVYRDIVQPADFGKEQAELDAALGDLAVLRLQLLVRLALAELVALLAFELLLHLRPDPLELLLDDAGGDRDVVRLLQLVEQRALDAIATRRGILALNPLRSEERRVGKECEAGVR